MYNELFEDMMEPQYGEDKNPLDGTRVTQVILYFSAEDALELRRLAKEVMKAEMPNDYIERGNISDLYLILLRKHPACQK